MGVINRMGQGQLAHRPVLERIPDEAVVPEVSFDINLGKKYSFVDFDYEAYLRSVHEMDGTDEDFWDADITISHGGIPTIRGAYNPIEGSIRVKAGARVNNTLAHETRHYIDDRQGKLSRKDAIKANLSLLACNASMLTYLSTKAMSFLPETIALGEFGRAWSGEAYAAYLGGLAAQFYFYYLSPAEVRARQSARENRRSPVRLVR